MSYMADELGAPRNMRRLAVKLEQKAWRSGTWGKWERAETPNGGPGSGWVRDIRWIFKNDLYVVLCRPLKTEIGAVVHCAIRTASHLEPPWRDKQRIKSELFGPERSAVEVMPPEDETVDEVEMYHIWILPEGYRLPFTLWRGKAL